MRAVWVYRASLAGIALGALSCNLITGANEGIPRGGEIGATCSTINDCDASASECRTPKACEGGRCVFEYAIQDTPIAAQTPGDCAEVVCDGAGKTRVIPVATDAPDDGDVCTLDICNGTTAEHRAQEWVPCYSGPAGTKDKGICVSGVQHCDAQGKPVGGCAGEVIPQAEVCDPDKKDEDCDGQVNEEGSFCVCGDTFISKGEECDDGGTVDGDRCSAKCQTERVLQVAAGGGHTCALRQDGTVKCWGNNDQGQLGLGDTNNRGNAPNQMGAQLPVLDLGGVELKPYQYSDFQPVNAIEVGKNHSCAVLGDGNVKCWGKNNKGQLGQGDTTPRGREPNEMGNNLEFIYLDLDDKAAAVAVGVEHTCVLSKKGHVKCFGNNSYGRLGLGDELNRGDEPNEMGDKLPFVDLGTGKVAVAIGAGEEQTCALLSDGQVKCWGSNFFCELGHSYAPYVGVKPADMGDNLPSVELGSGAVAISIAVGSFHTCALLSDGHVKCWGRNYPGILGLELGQLDHSCSLVQPGMELPSVDLGSNKRAIAITADEWDSCALLSDGSVKCWGANLEGELGLGHTAPRGDWPGEMGDNLPAVDLGSGRTAVAISEGSSHACAVLDDGSMKCWGANGGGQLGLGDNLDRGDYPGEMGDNLPTAKLFSSTW